jgi:drug/metabolite transporter (DMT)-like permease
VSVISTGVAYLILFYVIKSAGSGNATLVTLVVAPVSVILGAFVLNEALHFEAYIGFGLIAMGLLILDGRILKRFFRKSIA